MDAGTNALIEQEKFSGPANVDHQVPVTEIIKELGARIAGEWQRVRPEDSPLSPLLAAFTARCISLEFSDRFDFERGLSLDNEQELVRMTMELAASLDNPIFDTIKMQVTFESLYATELQKIRKKASKLETQNSQLLDHIVEIGTNIQSNTQVASLYRSIFKLLLANSGVDPSKIDRTVEREVAAALESVFPQAGLNAFNMMNVEEKRKQIKEIISIVLGIRLFNLEIKKGGAGLVDVPGLALSEVNALFHQIESEASQINDQCYTYVDILNLERKVPGTIAASVDRLQAELTNRRQYVLLLHQLQHEVLESLDVVKNTQQRLADDLEQLKTMVRERNGEHKSDSKIGICRGLLGYFSNYFIA
jgi:hypothetical protein